MRIQEVNLAAMQGVINPILVQAIKGRTQNSKKVDPGDRYSLKYLLQALYGYNRYNVLKERQIPFKLSLKSRKFFQGQAV